MKENIEDLDNATIMTVACYLVGGATIKVSTEIIWDRAFKLAPSKFCWSFKEYSHYPDSEVMRKGLFGARTKKYLTGAYARNSVNDGWKLTEIGIAYIKELEEKYNLGKSGTKKKISNIDKKIIERFKKHKLAKHIMDEKFNIYALAELLDTNANRIDVIRTRLNDMINFCSLADDKTCLEIIDNIKATNKFDDFFDKEKLINQNKARHKSS